MYVHTHPKEAQWKYCYCVLQLLEFFLGATMKLVGLHSFNLLFKRLSWSVLNVLISGGFCLWQDLTPFEALTLILQLNNLLIKVLVSLGLLQNACFVCECKDSLLYFVRPGPRVLEMLAGCKILMDLHLKEGIIVQTEATSTNQLWRIILNDWYPPLLCR